MQNAEGAILSPFDCWLCLRGLKTMALRMEAQARNCAILAKALSQHPLITKINYPGLPGSRGYELNAAQATSGGSLFSFETGKYVLSLAFALAGIACNEYGLPLADALASQAQNKQVLMRFSIC